MDTPPVTRRRPVWAKVWTDLVADLKIRGVHRRDGHADALGCWCAMVLLAKSADRDGELRDPADPAVPLDADGLADILGLPVAVVRNCLQHYRTWGWTHSTDGVIVLTRFRQRQECESRARVAIHRKLKENRYGNGPGNTPGNGGGNGQEDQRTRGTEEQIDRTPPIPLKGVAPDPCPKAGPRGRPRRHDPLLLNVDDWTWEGITDADRAGWREAFPGVDLDLELAKAREWVRADPAHRRKVSWRPFLTRWFGRAQDHASHASDARRADPDRPGFDKFGREYSSHAMAREWGLLKAEPDAIDVTGEEVAREP